MEQSSPIAYWIVDTLFLGSKLPSLLGMVHLQQHHKYIRGAKYTLFISSSLNRCRKVLVGSVLLISMCSSIDINVSFRVDINVFNLRWDRIYYWVYDLSSPSATPIDDHTHFLLVSRFSLALLCIRRIQSYVEIVVLLCIES